MCPGKPNSGRGGKDWKKAPLDEEQAARFLAIQERQREVRDLEEILAIHVLMVHRRLINEVSVQPLVPAF